jgi:thioesterase domain-containing protein
VQPRGPYWLVGYSFGGVLAVEMARQLTAAGETVARVILIDTDNPAVPPRYYSWSERLAARWRLHHHEPVSQRLKHFGQRIFWGAIERRRREETHRQLELCRREQRRAPADLRPQEVREMHDALMQAYRPQPYAGAVTLLRGSEPNDKFVHTRALGWDGVLTGELQVIDIPGAHLDLFDPPFVTTLAEKLAEVSGARPLLV